MKLRLAYPVEYIHGALSKQPGIVAFPWRNLQCARAWVKPANPNSTDQAAIRNILAQCAQGYQLITAENRASWTAFAAANPRAFYTKEYALPEISAFVAVNSYRLINGVAISNTPPTDTADFLATDITTAVYAAGATTLTITAAHTGSTTTNRNWIVYITRSLPSAVRRVRKGDYVLADGVATGSIVALSASPQAIVITTPRFADWTDGDYIGIKLVPLSPEYNNGTVYEEVVALSVTA